MSDEVFGIMKRLDMDAVEVQIVLQCAPILTGIKMSNLLHVRAAQASEVFHMFEDSPVSCHVLYEWNGRVSILLYRKASLERYLKQGSVQRLMESFGCRDMELEEILEILTVRNQAYVEGKASYPHEVGLVLGYPPEDVRGFIEHGGRDYVLSGYWKVYGDPVRAQRIFAAYDRARDAGIRLAGKGFSVMDIMASYNIMKRRQLVAQI